MEKLESEQDFDRELVAKKQDLDFTQTIHNSYIEVAKGQLDRATQRAEFVQKAATAIAGAYTTILAFSFVISATPESKNIILPARGLAPTIFAGLAILFSTIYFAFITKPSETAISTSKVGTYISKQKAWRDTFILWTRNASGISRRPWLQASIISLGYSVLFLPSAYVNVEDKTILLLGIFSMIFMLFAILAMNRRDEDS